MLGTIVLVAVVATSVAWYTRDGGAEPVFAASGTAGGHCDDGVGRDYHGGGFGPSNHVDGGSR